MQEASHVSSFGKYRLIASLARGGMARVYLGLMAGPAGFHKLLVLKVMRGGALDGSPDAVRMFMNEARLAARIVHPNVVHTYEVGELNGRPFLAMEYVEGQTYRALQTRAGSDRLPLAEELRILSELARGLHCLHELRGYDGGPLHAVHRDVSPQNVLVGYDGQVRLLDFGIAKTSDPAHFTQVGVIKGKIDYIAPEQLRGEAVDRRADVFALGVMLWEAIAKRRFSGGSSVAEVAKAQARLKGSEPKIRELKPDVPEALAALLDGALALDPAARLADAASFADALDGYLQSEQLRPSAKRLASLMGELFAEDRDRMRKLVEQQIDEVKRSGFDAVSSDATGILPRLELKGPGTSSTLWPQADLDAGERASGRPTDTARVPVRTGTERPAWGEARGRLKPRSWAVIAIAVAVAGGAAWFTPSEESAAQSETAAAVQAPAATPTSAEASSNATPAPAPASEAPRRAARDADPSGANDSKVRIELTVVPKDARVTLDGVPLATPFSGELTRDGALHDVRATAPGFAPFRQLVGFDRDRELSIVLAPIARRPAQEAAPRPKSAAGTPRISLGIDTTDPYTNTKVR